jgi:hypothetical protein
MTARVITRRITALAAMSLAVMTLAACNGSMRAARSADMSGPVRMEASKAGFAVGGAMQAVDRTIIRNGSMSVTVRDVPAAQGEVEKHVQTAGGRITRIADYDGNISMSLRIPDPQLDAVLDAVARLGEVTRRSVSAEDVTAEVIDLDARVKSLQTSRDRLRALHDRTDTVEEIIAVERELARVQGELDSLQGRLNQLRTDAAYSTVQLDLRQKQRLGPLGLVLYGVGKVVTKLFVWD